RHTSFSRDWSSDVCSSDRAPKSAPTRVTPLNQRRPRQPGDVESAQAHADITSDPTTVVSARMAGTFNDAPPLRPHKGASEHQPRSEERRVGKEGRARRHAA